METNLIHIKKVMSKYPDEFAPILELCPNFEIILAHMLVFRLGWRVEDVDWTSDMKDWNEKDCRRVGRAMSTVMRMVQTGLMALDAWKKHYVQLNIFFDKVEGFEDFMAVIASNLLRDNRFGMAFRVSVGAALSTIDAATDIYVVKKYYESEELVGQGNALLAMISGNMLVQLIMVVGNYQRKSWKVKLREAIICLSFLRPAVDAYRVSTSHEDEDISTDTLSEMLMNKGESTAADDDDEVAQNVTKGAFLRLSVW